MNPNSIRINPSMLGDTWDDVEKNFPRNTYNPILIVTFETPIENAFHSDWIKFKYDIPSIELVKNFIRDGKEDSLYIEVNNRNEREEIHQYVREYNCGKNEKEKYLARSEYMAYGAERKCCGVWYKSSNYGEGWNGGSIDCAICFNYSFIDYDNYEEASDDKKTRFSEYRPTGDMIICKANYNYKKKTGKIWSYRKRY